VFTHRSSLERISASRNICPLIVAMFRGVPNIPPPMLGFAPNFSSFFAAKYFSSLMATASAENYLSSRVSLSCGLSWFRPSIAPRSSLAAATWRRVTLFSRIIAGLNSFVDISSRN